ncbi:hypothetical protein D3OALGB2SA_21 [Olavius algarvensis associated proteobacterium Delta 3]|nr:hypothetical protein D3OALGB2SA_21 [Olavius algarvensis associated proteobacterium Delta 3]
MVISVHQPYFCPYPGFFYRVLNSDVFVLLDTVQFPRGTTWTSRNRFKHDQGTLWLTVPVRKKGLGFQTIDAVRICRDRQWPRKHLTSLRHAYAHAPFFREHYPFIEAQMQSGTRRLSDLNIRIIRYIADYIRVGADIRRLSEMGIRGKGAALLIDICRQTGATQLLIPRSARSHMDIAAFQTAGIRIDTYRMPMWIYPQLWGDFLPNLSILDMIFNIGPKTRDLLRS